MAIFSHIEAYFKWIITDDVVATSLLCSLQQDTTQYSTSAQEYRTELTKDAWYLILTYKFGIIIVSIW